MEEQPEKIETKGTDIRLGSTAKSKHAYHNAGETTYTSMTTDPTNNGQKKGCVYFLDNVGVCLIFVVL